MENNFSRSGKMFKDIGWLFRLHWHSLLSII